MSDAVPSQCVGNLPAELTSFVGRRTEVAEAKRLLSASRLVTVTGMGGVGKTRLARRVAGTVRRGFPDGVWLVELSQLRRSELLPLAVMHALGVPTLSTRQGADLLAEYLRDKRMLLVIDNCEHLVDECASLVTRMLGTAAKLRVLATSRTALGVPGEHLLVLPTLSVPNPGDALSTAAISQSEAITLFEQRAAAVLPGFRVVPRNGQAVASLCQHLDGLPLAIELAAVQMRTLTVEQIVDRLNKPLSALSTAPRGVAPRHQTLRAMVDWSYDLCSEEERGLWARLSVFCGGFDLRAAEHVCVGDGISSDAFLQVFSRLVDKSIVLRHDIEQNSRRRYGLLDTIREYGQERLAELGGESVYRWRHVDHYLDLAEQSEAEWFGPEQAAWYSRLHEEHANFRAALEACLGTPGKARKGLRIAASLWFYWTGCSSLHEGRHWLDRALTIEREPSVDRAKALWASGYLAIRQGDMSAALATLEECRQLALQLEDEATLAHAVQLCGYAELLSNKLSLAVPLLEQALSYERALKVPSAHLATALFRLALATGLQGDVKHALTLCEECREICNDHSESWGLSWSLWVLGVLRWLEGDVSQMAAHLHQCLQIERPGNDPIIVAFCIEFLAWAAAAQGEAERSAELLGISRNLWKPFGEFLFGFQRYMEWHEQCERQTRHALGEREFQIASRRGAQLSISQAISHVVGGKPKRSSARPPAEQSLLTPREEDVAELVAKGLLNKEIAEQLVISRRTAEAHVEHILVKLGFTSRSQIAAWWSAQQQSPSV